MHGLPDRPAPAISTDWDVPRALWGVFPADEGVHCWLNGDMSNTASLQTRSTPKGSLADLASAAKPDRNRAVDFYRAIAMLAVAFGHWAAIATSVDANGEPSAGNALEYAPSMSWVTWLFQVMPLFFVVGGFSSAMSLDSHFAKSDSRHQDWIAARLRRMVAPAITLATTWTVLLIGGYMTGIGALIGAGAAAAAIPLWFLSNYTIDTAIAPFVLPRFRQNPRLFAVGAIGVFVGLEALRFSEIPVLHHLAHLNWVLGWLLFQVAGFAWRDGMLPTGARLAAISAGLWTAAVAAVTLGPWPTAMVHFPGLENSPTHPPSLALMLFGAAYSSTAILFAPRISAFLARNKSAWSAVVGANAVAMSVYLWHMTAAIGAVLILWGLGWLPTAEVGTFAWWLQKLPMFGLATLILAGIVAKVAKVEQAALLAPRTPWKGGMVSIFGVAALLSASLKMWASGSVVIVAICIATVLATWHGALKTRA